ncbi:MAG: hypothetical protein AUJ72_04100 [Candidatus Omnitrophica bacterium CG1_02_46_14]|nr:MAG: hypothetical protein AUJ72_04100 [Candidatus Omnitrophica bacterium CG1_02_46_14]
MDPRIVTGSRTQASESNFISKVYWWMSIGLGVSAMASYWLMLQPDLLKAIFVNPVLMIVLVVAELGLVIWLSAAAVRMSVPLTTSVFLVYSFLNGITFTPILLIYTNVSIYSTFAITAGTFLFFSVYGMTTKKDLTSMGSLMMMGLIGIIIASVVNIFLKSPVLYWISTFVGIAVFMGLIAWDTQKLKGIHAMGFDSEELQKKVAILGALTLYLDFINLFIMLLRIFGRRRS